MIIKKCKVTLFRNALFALAIVAVLTVGNANPWDHGSLEVSKDKRMLQHKDGTGFFWLGDTAWQLPFKLNREEAETYFQNRKDKGFSVIQIAVEHWGSSYHDLAFTKWDTTKPNEVYWQYMDSIITMAEENGLYVGLLPNWNGQDLTTSDSARTYGAWIGDRYKNRPNIIWILGGDHDPSKDNKTEVWNLFAHSLRKVIGTKQLMTYHPSGGRSSSYWFNDESWIDFNMLQSGHSVESLQAAELLLIDYKRNPVKPVIDGEPCYETISKWFYKPKSGPRYSAEQVRAVAYTQLFHGGFGHTYGHHSIWQFHKDGEKWSAGKGTVNWLTALDDEAGKQMQYLGNLMRSRPILERVPDQTIIVDGTGIATRGKGYVFVFLRQGGEVTLDLGRISGASLTGWWYNPRNGKATKISDPERFANNGQRAFTAPDTKDWILVLDDRSHSYSEPGTD